MGNEKIALLGCGFMARAIAAGLIEKKVLPGENIIAVNEHNPTAAESFARELKTSFGGAERVSEAQAAITCFKPQSFYEAMPAYARYLRPGALLISIMAGISIEDIEAELPENTAVIRAMPNLAISVGMGATGYAAGKNASAEHIALCDKIFSSLGIADRVEEKDISGVTALSGSGPAYFYYLAECMIKAAVESGMDEAAAKRLCRQTFIGTAEMWKNDTAEPQEMRRRITSKKGTTDAAVSKMEEKGFFEAVAEGMRACRGRSDEIGREMAKK